MHEIEPYFFWRDDYIAAEDERSPFFKTEYSEFYYDKQLYNFVIHPQWDCFGSNTLYIKVLYADYDRRYVIIELIGEWNDAIGNDIMLLKREIIEMMLGEGLVKFILIGENVLNFHASDDSYYEEWFLEIDDENGWVACINFNEHVIKEFRDNNIDYYVNFGGHLNDLHWRKLKPLQFFKKVEEILTKRIT